MISQMELEHKLIRMGVHIKEISDSEKNKEGGDSHGLMERRTVGLLRMGSCKEKGFTSYQMEISMRVSSGRIKDMERED